ncbi:hypothetical protein [Actinomadura sp. GTD37]|uniref:hypothetical protein n=1 Tax=Actinomadura sp. GTD37 TaxID=1778030 RepID=UPI0035C01207
MTDDHTRHNLLNALTHEALDADSYAEAAPGTHPAPFSIKDLAALAANLPEPPPVRRLEAGWDAARQLLAATPKTAAPASPLAQLTGIPIVTRYDMHPAAWRLVDADGNVLREHVPEADGTGQSEETV